MTQNELNQLVANQTGEDESTIKKRGFSLQENPNQTVRLPLVVDWDEVQSERRMDGHEE